VLFYNALYLKRHAVKQLLCGHGKSLSKKKKKSTKLYLLFTVVKDKKNVHVNTEGYQRRPLKPSLPFSRMNYSGRARDVKIDQTSPCER